jgi:DNA-binding SARP family transcriptional activator/TolB-like protein
MIRLRTLGSLDLRTAADAPVQSVLAQPRRTAILVYLGLGLPDFRRKDTLYALFWPERDADSARHALRQTLYFLRRSLGDGVVVARGNLELGLAPERFWCDAAALEEAVASARHEEALDLYRGDLLEGFHAGGAPGFERWLEDERIRLRDLAAGAGWELAAAREAAGDIEGAAHAARRAAELAPANEVAVRRLLALLDRLGDRAGAVRAFDDFAARLREEYDLEPSAETSALNEAIRASAGRLPVEESAPEETDVAAMPPAASPASDSAARGRPASLPDAMSRPAHDTEQTGPPARSRFRLAVAVALALAAGLAWAAWRSAGPHYTATTTPTLVAVLPFAVHGDGDVEHFGAGVASLLSSGLDGAGEWRSVDPYALLAQLGDARADPLDLAAGRRIAQRFGAGLFVLGEVMEAGGQVRIRASLYDVADDDLPRASAAAEGLTDHLFELVDRIAAALLVDGVGGDRRLAHSAASTTRSLPALKAYLEGEQAFRAGRHTAAMAAFEEATDHDPAFALAYYRLSVAADWARQFVRAGEAIERALEHLDALPGYERLLVRAAFAWNRGSAVEAVPLFHEAVAIRPSDAEAWNRLGEVLFHLNTLRGRSADEARIPFQRVLELDPDHMDALIHLALLAAAAGRDD